MNVSNFSIARTCTYPHLHESVRLQEVSSTYLHTLFPFSIVHTCTLPTLAWKCAITRALFNLLTYTFFLLQLCTLALCLHLHESVHLQEPSSTYLLLLRASPPTPVSPPTCTPQFQMSSIAIK
jgi:hypothetical protein